jgi:dihydrofolate reductase
MPKLRVAAFSISLDGYAAGPDQSLENPLGRGGEALHEWFMPSGAKAVTAIDAQFAARSFENIGAWILGRNMFGPVRGAWPDETWRGWWGENPPYDVPVFVVTHHKRPPLEMAGGTIFHFVTDGADAALVRARDAAGDRDVRVGGGAATVRQYLKAGQIDEIHLAIAPIVLGRGEALFEGIDLNALGFHVSEHVPSQAATHVVLTKKSSADA